MSDVLAEVDRLVAQAEAELADVHDAIALEQWRIKYLGAKGAVKDMMQLIGKASKEEKPLVGQRVNSAKQQISSAFEAKTADLGRLGEGTSKDGMDVTEPGARPKLGNRHVLNKVIDELTDLFARMGFATAAGPEVEDEFHNFIALNIPPQHPARDPLDNFYLTGDGNNSALSTQHWESFCSAPRRVPFKSA